MIKLVRFMNTAALTVAARDTIGMLAVASLSYGAWLAYRPAGFIIGGCVVLAGVLASARDVNTSEGSPLRISSS
ncbi:MAG: hypothetical protein JWR80_1037 [Bradyrhizobium sp.]|nr:hypothetical protein [Bradyrhizobium sp.]